jgi:hypothetical protein
MKAQPYQNLCDTAKAVLRRKLIAMNAYVTNKKISHIRPKAASQIPRKIRQAKFKTSQSREIIKIRAKINEIETSTKKRKEEKHLQ